MVSIYVFTAQIAEADGTPVFKFKRWRIKGQIIPEVFEQYKAVRRLFLFIGLRCKSFKWPLVSNGR